MLYWTNLSHLVVPEAQKTFEMRFDLSSRKKTILFNKYTDLNLSVPIKATELYNEKNRLDWYFKNKLHELYYRSRNQVCPEPPHNYLNRAGKKLDDILTQYSITYSIFLDICAGPGAFSDYLLQRNPDSLGYGISQNTTTEKNFYTTLRIHDRYCAVEEDILTNTNFKAENIDFVLADGARNEDEYDETLQEIYNSKLILAEVIISLNNLKTGGTFILKMFDTFLDFTKSIIYLLTRCFQSVSIYKPDSSRPVNSERYIII